MPAYLLPYRQHLLFHLFYVMCLSGSMQTVPKDKQTRELIEKLVVWSFEW